MGSVAPGNPESERSSSGYRHLNRLLSWGYCGVLIFALLCGALPVAAQSGRRKESGQKNNSPQGPIADPNRPSTAPSTTQTAKKDPSATRSPTASDAAEQSYDARISSND